MSSTTHRSIAGIAFLLIGLALVSAVALTVSRAVRADPGVLYAAPSAVGSGGCSSWADACTLQAALAGAAGGDEIWVQAGVHYPGGNVTDTFALQSGVALYGGFAGSETSRDERNWQTNVTVLSGDIDGNDLTDSYGVITTTAHITGTNAYHVVTSVGVTETAVLDGFVITAGQANGTEPDNHGAGMLNSGSPTLTNVTFSGNTAESGGGIYNHGTLLVMNSTVIGNSVAFRGGGIFNSGTLTVTNSTISGNSATTYGASSGGGIANEQYGTSTVTNSTLSGNSATYGGGISNDGTLTLENSTIYGSHADWGSGIISYGALTVTNCTLSGNHAANWAAGLYNHATSAPIIQNSIFWNGADTVAQIGNTGASPVIRFSLVQGCNPGGVWNTDCGTDGGHNLADADPLFVAPEPASSAPTKAGDYRLQDSSPAINAGSNVALPPGIVTDVDGNPRFVRVFVDMGAYENQAFPCPAGGILYVDQDAAGAQTGASWSDALTTLQDALQVSEACEIWVAAGVYRPDEGGSRADNNRSAAFTLKSGVALYGGFAGTETSREQRDWTFNLTVLSGDIDQNDLTDPTGVVTTTAQITGTNSYHVVTSSSVTETAVLDGFVITAGQANGAEPDNSGGGMLNESSSPTLMNMTFSGNMAVHAGGGMSNFSGNPTLTNVTFSSNMASNGGGMYNEGESPTLTDVTFSGNTASDGGGMSSNGSSPDLTDVIFSGNSATYEGGGMRSTNNNSTLINVVFNSNTAGHYGGGMYNGYDSTPTLINVTFSGNSANNAGGGLSNYLGCQPTLTNVILWGNTAPSGAGIWNDSSTPQISTSDIQGCGGSGSWNSACGADGGGNIEADPLFVDAANGDLRLQDTSPAINAGYNAALPSGILTDLDGAPRFVRVLVDLGAYENQTFPCPAGGVLYVDRDATGAQTGESWDDALVTLQDALQVTEACEIWIAEGVYYPDEGGSHAADDGVATFRLKSGVDLYGGFVGTETSREPRDWQANSTVLSGDLEQDDVDLDGDGLLALTEAVGINARHVVYAEDITSPIHIEGLTIRSGLNDAGDGAGMRLANSVLTMQDAVVESNHAVNGGGIASIYSSVTLEGVTFLGNSAIIGNTGGGGGLYIHGAIHGYWQTVGNVTFVDNHAGRAGGGGLRVQYSPVDVTHSTFISNTATSDYEVADPVGGGGMVVAYSNQTTIADTLFRDNHAVGRLTGGDDIPERFFGHGGGLHVHESGYQLTDVTFEGNSAALGGGFYTSVHGEGHLREVTFTNNHAYYLGGGAYSGAIDPYYHQAVFTHNRAPYCGALCGWLTIEDSVFAHNHAYDPNPNDTNVHGIGGALNGLPGRITNSAFYSNTADHSGPDLASWYAGGEFTNVTMASGISCPAVGSSMSVINSIIATMTGDCTVTFRHSIYGALSITSVTDGGGNLPDVDPLFVDLASGDLHLQLDSPAIDSGNSDLATYGIGGAPILYDLDGNPRVVDIPTVPDTGSGPPPIVDIGAYEAQYVDVALGKAVLPPAAAPGEAITFTLAVSNTGSLPVTGIVVTDTLPAWLWGVSISSTLTLTDTGALPPYAWRVQDLARGQGGVITLSGVLTVPLAAGIYTNTASVSAAGDLLVANHTSVITFSVPNVAPDFTSVPIIGTTEDALCTYTAVAQDDNGDALTVTASTLPGWLALVDHGDGTATLSGTPTNADVGENAVALQVTDSGGLSDTQSFTLTVENANDPPEFTSTPVLTATQDALYTYPVAAADPDLIHGDALTLTAPTHPAWLTLTDHGNGTATLAGAPVNADVGDHTVELRVTDSAGSTATQAFTVTVANVNDPPAFTSAPLTTATEAALYTYAVAAADPDLIHGDVLTMTAPTLPDWLTLTDHGNGAATIAGTPETADVGDHAVVLQVSDSRGLTGTQSFTLTVENANDPPEFTSAPVLTATQDALYAYAVTADDPDLIFGDALTLTAPTLPGWLALTDHGDGSATLSGMPANADVGDHAVVLLVTDSGGLTDTQAFTVTVANVNDPPAFTSAPALTAAPDVLYTYAIAAEDPDLIHGDALTLTALPLPGWLTMVDHGDGTGYLFGTPTHADVGEHAVVLQVVDRAGLTATQSFRIAVSGRVYLPLVVRSVP